jgi:hypothetical protein
MVRYFFAWMPLVIVATVVLLALPWLGLIALMLFSLVTLAALAGTIVAVPYMLGRAIGRRWQRASGASPRTAAVLSPANSGARRTRRLPVGTAALLANAPAERDRA